MRLMATFVDSKLSGSAGFADRINDAIQRFDLAYVKLDLTTIFNAYGEAPGCWAKDHDHGSWAESLIRIYEGISYVTSRVYEKYPEILLDLTFELWGQKHIIDAGLLAAGVVIGAKIIQGQRRRRYAWTAERVGF